MDGTTEMLIERGKTHGDFVIHARVTQRLKAVIYDEIEERITRGQPAPWLDQVEALDMIAHKIGRIIAGNADFADHWDDIAGYAKLCSKPPALDDEYPFRNHRTMAEVMQDEDPCPLDGRNCAPDHDHPSFGEGDETTYKPPCNHHRLTANCPICDPKPDPHIHRWRMKPGHLSVMVCGECDEERPVVDQKPGQYAIKLPEIDLVDEKYPCDCRDIDRCRIENGRLIGKGVFCCKAEAGR